MPRLKLPVVPSVSGPATRIARWALDAKRALELNDRRVLRWEGGDSEDWIGVDGDGNEFVLMQVKREVLSLTSGTSQTASSFIPAGVLQLGVFLEVTETITGPASINVGLSDAGLNTVYGSAIGLTAGTKTTWTNFDIRNAGGTNSAIDVVVEANAGSFTAGEVLLKCPYFPSLP